MANDFEKFLKKSAVFSSERISELNADLVQLEKSAGLSSAGQFLRASAIPLATILGTAAIQSGVAYLGAKRQLDAHQKALGNSRAALLKTKKDFSKSPELFHQRFSELALISPTVAANPGLAGKVLEPRMKKGFNLEDVHRLSSIEYHSSMAPRPQQPSAAARAQAMIGAGGALQYILPSLAVRAATPEMVKAVGGEMRRVTDDKKLIEEQTKMVDEMRNVVHPKAPQFIDTLMEYVNEQKAKGIPEETALRKAKAMQNKAQQDWTAFESKWANHPNENIRTVFADLVAHTLKKEASAMKPRVSEECLGKMLADTHLMCKEAGIMTSVSSFLKPSAKHIANYVKAMTIPLTIGIGVKMLQGVMDNRNKEQLRSEAMKVFEQVKKQSDVINENPAIASQAFDALKSFAPALAVKPIIVKTFVENVVNGQGHLDPNTANMLAQTQQAVQTIDRHTGGGFIAGLKEPMSLFQFKVPGKEEKKS